MTGEGFDRLHRALGMGDLELRFHDGRSIKAHGLKLKLSALDGILCNLIDDVLDDQITDAAAKRKRVDPAGAAVDLPVLKVCAMRPPCRCPCAAGRSTALFMHANPYAIGFRLTGSMKTGWRC